MSGLLWFIGSGLMAGCLAGVLVKASGSRILWDIVAGVLGGISGGYAFGSLGSGTGGLFGQLLMATAAAAFSVFVLRLAGKTAQARQLSAASTCAVSAPAMAPAPLIRRPRRAFGTAALSRTDMTSHLG